MKKTNEQLKTENIALQEKLKTAIENDLMIRTELSKLLDSYEYEQNTMYGRIGTRKVVVMSWMEIAFEIGELKSDANYSLVLDQLKNVKMENESRKGTIDLLEQNIKRLKNGERIDECNKDKEW